MDRRVGLGIDLHPWAEERPLHLAGVRFEGHPGLAGHSDGDVVCHAVADALLGAAVLGDIGGHFPDDDPSFRGLGGLDLLARIVGLLAEAGAIPRGCDVTYLAHRPLIASRREEMRRNLAAALNVPVDRVSVKATRPEGLGLTGDGAGCWAVATVDPIDRS